MVITVAVPTCDRPKELDRCLSSLAAVRFADWRLMVIDQSGQDDTRSVVERWAIDIPNLRYLRLVHQNASAARNLALDLAEGDVIAFLDDDCTIGPDWLQQVSESFERTPAVRVVFGSVTAASVEPDASLVPTYVVSRQRERRGRLAGLGRTGIGASMYMALKSPPLPRFDPCLGPGSRFRGSQDWDFTYRLLARGELAIETPRIHVQHHGARAFAGGAARRKIGDYAYGAGAAHMKLLRCGEWLMVVAILRKLAVSIVALRPLNLASGQPTRAGALIAYLRGLLDSFTVPVDRPMRLYRWDTGSAKPRTTPAPPHP